jgi:hypothetical protein
MTSLCSHTTLCSWIFLTRQDGPQDTQKTTTKRFQNLDWMKWRMKCCNLIFMLITCVVYKKQKYQKPFLKVDRTKCLWNKVSQLKLSAKWPKNEGTKGVSGANCHSSTYRHILFFSRFFLCRNPNSVLANLTSVSPSGRLPVVLFLMSVWIYRLSRYASADLVGARTELCTVAQGQVPAALYRLQFDHRHVVFKTADGEKNFTQHQLVLILSFKVQTNCIAQLYYSLKGNNEAMRTCLCHPVFYNGLQFRNENQLHCCPLPPGWWLQIFCNPLPNQGGGEIDF